MRVCVSVCVCACVCARVRVWGCAVCALCGCVLCARAWACVGAGMLWVHLISASLCLWAVVLLLLLLGLVVFLLEFFSFLLWLLLALLPRALPVSLWVLASGLWFLFGLLCGLAWVVVCGFLGCCRWVRSLVFFVCCLSAVCFFPFCHGGLGWWFGSLWSESQVWSGRVHICPCGVGCGVCARAHGCLHVVCVVCGAWVWGVCCVCARARACVCVGCVCVRTYTDLFASGCLPSYLFPCACVLS